MNRWLLLVACAACASSEPYEVLASANLAPGTLNIEGPLQLLGSGEVKPHPLDGHMLAAYHVRLPDDTPRRIRLFTPASCDTPHADVKLVWDLGEIRRVGDETHFFATGVVIGERTIDVDVMTRYAYVHLDPSNPPYNALNMIAVVQDLPLGDAPDPDPGAGLGDWLACGVFLLEPSQ